MRNDLEFENMYLQCYLFKRYTYSLRIQYKKLTNVKLSSTDGLITFNMLIINQFFYSINRFSNFRFFIFNRFNRLFRRFAST